MGHLSEEDRKRLEELRDPAQLGILQDEYPTKLDLSNGIIAVVCADGDQFEDKHGHLAEIVNNAIGRPRVHTISLNGGPLLLSFKSPAYQCIESHDQVHEFLVNQIAVGQKIKDMNTVVLCTHAPCGVAGLCGMDINAVLDHLVEAKQDLKERLGETTKIACFLHVDYGDGKKRSYFVSASRWLKYRSMV
ncbi:hypothetical protein KJ641_04020 [Patescibacteria group bacterium]|nr:hypothetical protein [Patescibacteria group bacterium]MBU1896006.1 hypothetical protein [Patescibacteria group bacterium]